MSNLPNNILFLTSLSGGTFLGFITSISLLSFSTLLILLFISSLFKNFIGFVILVLVLFIKPSGILNEEAVED